MSERDGERGRKSEREEKRKYICLFTSILYESERNTVGRDLIHFIASITSHSYFYFLKFIFL